MRDLSAAVAEIMEYTPYRCILTSPRDAEKPYYRIQLDYFDGAYHVEKYTQKQTFHSRMTAEEAAEYLTGAMQEDYRNLHAWDSGNEYEIRVTKKEKILFRKQAAPTAPKPRTAHDHEKTALFPKGMQVPPLYDMGIFTQEGKVAAGMYDKYRQINRFIETIDDALKTYPEEELRILDFGCGKSYLTFVLYHYLTKVRGKKVWMTGLDLKKEVIEKCNAAAKKYGYDTLHFQVGDISEYQYTGPLDMVITLHACDTATDYALYNAVRWGAKMIFSVPCCQHELNAQIRPQRLGLLTRYGIVQERFCALATDAIRANLLESCGYRTQLVEFIALEHTPKNILIRAVRTGGPGKQSLWPRPGR